MNAVVRHGKEFQYEVNKSSVFRFDTPDDWSRILLIVLSSTKLLGAGSRLYEHGDAGQRPSPWKTAARTIPFDTWRKIEVVSDSVES